MRVIILGGHGKVALLLSPLLVTAGHEVTAVIRNAAQTHDVSAVGSSPLVADLAELTVDGMAEILAGQNAVVWSAGAGGGSPARTKAIDRDAAIRSMDAALLAGVDRYVMVSYFGAGHDHGVEPSDSFRVRRGQECSRRPPRDEHPQLDHPPTEHAHRRPGNGLHRHR